MCIVGKWHVFQKAFCTKKTSSDAIFPPTLRSALLLMEVGMCARLNKADVVRPGNEWSCLLDVCGQRNRVTNVMRRVLSRELVTERSPLSSSAVWTWSLFVPGLGVLQM